MGSMTGFVSKIKEVESTLGTSSAFSLIPKEEVRWHFRWEVSDIFYYSGFESILIVSLQILQVQAESFTMHHYCYIVS
jgi:hypothetical protein